MLQYLSARLSHVVDSSDSLIRNISITSRLLQNNEILKFSRQTMRVLRVLESLLLTLEGQLHRSKSRVRGSSLLAPIVKLCFNISKLCDVMSNAQIYDGLLDVMEALQAACRTSYELLILNAYTAQNGEHQECSLSDLQELLLLLIDVAERNSHIQVTDIEKVILLLVDYIVMKENVFEVNPFQTSADNIHSDGRMHVVGLVNKICAYVSNKVRNIVATVTVTDEGEKNYDKTVTCVPLQTERPFVVRLFTTLINALLANHEDHHDVRADDVQNRLNRLVSNLMSMLTVNHDTLPPIHSGYALYVMADCYRYLSIVESTMSITLSTPSMVGHGNENGWMYYSATYCLVCSMRNQYLSTPSSLNLLDTLLSLLSKSNRYGSKEMSLATSSLLKATSSVVKEIFYMKIVQTMNQLLVISQSHHSSRYCNLLSFAEGVASSADFHRAEAHSIRIIMKVIDVVVQRGHVAYEEIDMDDEILSRLVSLLNNGLIKLSSRKSKRQNSKITDGSVDENVSASVEMQSTWSLWMWSVLAELSGIYCEDPSKMEKVHSEIVRKGRSMMQRAAMLMDLMESLLGWSSSTLSSTVGVIGMAMRRLIVVMLQWHNVLQNKSYTSSCLRAGARVMTAAATCKDLSKHVAQLAAIIVDGLVGLNISSEVRELLIPGLFALFDRCQYKQKKQMYSLLDMQGGTILQDLHEIYMRDFKFIGKA